eukprot:NODE_2926_length_1062_cov_30.915508_g2792_i0.p1 GENE.NODE_2926_length_1062_cov_30.915508_g2792_i0~~NODE_2926_length_1062_cov_30.915508_g2792_i0.p1  ORF type:complete len:230 (+),score=62.58 NODE_2926_length_1062_cov_30.915508_g2792_i0:253-942(+)
MKAQMAVVADLREAKLDAEAELRLANQELINVQRQLADEKKRRKRAEKLLANGVDQSAEVYKNQTVVLKAEVERKDSELQAMQYRLDNQLRSDRPTFPNGKKININGTDRIQILELKLKEVTEKVEERDRLLLRQGSDAKKVTQLESQLQVANDRIAALTGAGGVNEVRDASRLLAAQAQMDTRYLISLDPLQRSDALRRPSESRFGVPKPPLTLQRKPSSRGRADFDL